MSTRSSHGVAHDPHERPSGAEVTADLVRSTYSTGGTFKLIAIVLAVLTVLGVVGVILKFINYGDDQTRWGYVVAAMVFVLTAGTGAPMVAIAPALAKANWIRPVTRIAALFSVTGIVSSLMLIPILFMLPPLITQGARRRSIWFEGPDYSPHIWGMIALLGLTLAGLGLLYSSALPDLAAMRDHATGWRQRWGKRLARGFIGTEGQWRTLRLRIGMFGTLYFLLLVFTHFLISTDIGQSMVAGWRDAIFPMYHAMTSIQAGVAGTILVMWIARRFGGMDRYLHLDQFWSLGKLLFATSLLWFYFFISAFMVYWYGRAGADKLWLDLLIRGPMIWAFLGAFTFSFFVPWWFLIWNRTRTSINGPAIAAVIVLFGALLDRMRLYVPAWSVDPTRIHERFLTEIPTTQWPDIFDILIFVGGISAAILLYMLATRLIPIVSIWEVHQSNLLSRPAKFIRGHGVLVAKPD
ncbi:MAG: NrfD/PsrC family molybdoenzyme membrane anchor subunit [Dehalococcoidia bacterium]